MDSIRRSLLILSCVLCAWGPLACPLPAQNPGSPTAPGSAAPAGAPAATDRSAPSVPAPSVPDRGTAAAIAPPERKHPQTYLDFAVAGGPVMIAIALCSVIWFAFLVERLISTRRSKVLPPAIMRALQTKDAARSVPREQLDLLCKSHPSAIASIVRAALSRLDRPRVEIQEAVENAARKEIHVLQRNIRLFAILASVAPLLGLLGTVTGMIRSFREVAVEGLGAGKNLAPGIYEALINTAGGLIVAIPALLTYYWLMGRVERYVHQMDDTVVQLVDARA